MKNYIVVSTCNRLVRQVLLAIRSMSASANIVVVGNEKTGNLRWTPLCKANKVISFDRKGDAVFAETVNSFMETMPDAVLIPTDCDAARVVCRTRDRLLPRIVPMPNPSTMEVLDNKWRFYEFCTQHHIQVPETLYIGPKDNLNFQSIVSRLGLPFVLKPVNQAGSNGVHIVRSETYFNEAIIADDAYRFDTLIAQRYVAGVDLCFNFLAEQGRIYAMSTQQRVGPEIIFLNNPQLESLGYRLAQTSEYSGVMCIDARLEEESGKIYLIESNPRFWASLCASVWCGLNFVEEILEPTANPYQPHKLVSGRYHERHPIYRPTIWATLLADSSRHGRIFRAMMCDLPTVSTMVYSLPATVWGFMARRLSPQQVTRLYQ